MNIKISILIITYNQESIIHRTLDSILSQKDYGLYEIVISDDCSTDKTWNILEQYQHNFPRYIRLHKNDKNLGIYGNAENVISLKGDGELFYMMAGDDAICEGWLAKIQEISRHNSIDVNKPIGLYFDWQKINTENKKTIYSNKMIVSGIDPFRLKLRGKISARSMLVSKSVLDQFVPVILDKGVALAESMFDIQFHIYPTDNFYSSFVGTTYYSGIGVSTQMQNEKNYRQTIYKLNMFFSLYTMISRDKRYIKSIIHKNKFLIKPTVKEYFLSLLFHLLSLDYRIGIHLKYDILVYGSLFKKLLINTKR